MSSDRHKLGRCFYRFCIDAVVFDQATFQLHIAGAPVAVERRPLMLLNYLLENANELVTHDELHIQVWGAQVTVKNVLPNAMTKLRKALGESGKRIVTVSGLGYRLTGPVYRESSGRLPARIDLNAPLTEPRAAAPVLGRMSLAQRLQQFQDIARAVEAEHARGMVFSYIAPEEISVDDDGRISLPPPPLTHNLRKPAALYSAPESFRGADASVRGDIYALGVLLYQFITHDFSRPLLPDWLLDVADDQCRALISSATEPNPERRPTSIDEWLGQLAG